MRPRRLPAVVPCLLVLATAGTPSLAAGSPLGPPAAVRLPAPPDRPPRDAWAARLDARLHATLRPLRAAREGAGGLVATAVSPGADGLVAVAVRVRTVDLTGLAAAGLAVDRHDAARGLVEGRAAPAALPRLAARPDVIDVRPLEPGATQAGSVTSGGDAASGADRARTLGVDGQGVVVGVVSDGIDALAAVQARGDLPAVTVPADGRCRRGSGSEGTALLEIVHDLAPGATLLFASGIASPLAFVDAVACLSAAGARVVIDDLVFATEPFFQDGTVAAAVRAAVASGVSFHTVAGNLATVHYEAAYRGSPATAYHDFDGAVDNLNEVAIPAGGAARCILQWDDAFGASGNDYDLQVYDADARTIVTASEAVQDGDDDPLESIAVTNRSGGTEYARLAILRRRGSARTLELVCLGGGLAMQHVVAAGSVLGHAAVPEAVTAGAVPAAGGGVRSYSGRGPSVITVPAAEVRVKPDLVGFDGVATTTPGLESFLGTSAAAPHVGATAALMLQRNPFLLPAELRTLLAATAVDLGTPGIDGDTGAGRLDAFAAVVATPPPECFDAAGCADGDACTVEQCVRGRCARTPLGCDDGDPCNGAETCRADTGCLAGSPLADDVPCPDATVCNGAERCRAARCVAGAPLACVASDPCTAAGCDAIAGCRAAPLAGAASVSCRLDQGLPTCAAGQAGRGVSRRVARARRLVARAEAADRRSAQRVRLLRAARQLRRARQRVRQAAARARLTSECAAAQTIFLEDAEARARRAAGVGT